MRILLLVPSFPDSDNRFGPAVIDTLVEINKTHEIFVHSIGTPPRKGSSIYRGLKVFGHGSNRDSRIRRVGSFAYAVKNAHAPVDLVWSLWPIKTMPLARLTSTLLAKPMVSSLMGGELTSLPELNYGELRSSKSRRRLKNIFQHSAMLTVGSEKLRLSAQTLGAKCDVHLCPIGVPVNEFSDKRHRLASDSISIMIVSDSSPVKRVNLALNVAHELVKHGKTVTVDWFGIDLQGRVPSMMSKHANSTFKIKYHGYIDAETLRTKYCDFDVLLHTSAHESQGMALIEAAISNLPVVVGKVGVAAELKALGAAIEISANDSVSTFSQACLDVIGKSSKKSKVANKFGVEACAQRFNAVFEQCVAPK